MRGVIITDLDGTLLRGNSMKVFIKFLPAVLLRRGRLGAAVGALWWCFLRACRLSSHRNMKWHLSKIARRHFAGADWLALAQCLAKMLNPKVAEYIESRPDCSKYIATAAMAEYAVPLSCLLGFDGVLATSFAEVEADYAELRGREKLAAIEALLAEKNLRLEAFLTDHYDDLPVALQYPERTLLVDAGAPTLARFAEAGIAEHRL